MKRFTSYINMVTLPLLFTLLLVHFVSCDESPSIRNISTEQIKEIGEEAEFNCTVLSKSYPVLWIKLDKARQNPTTLSSDDLLIIRLPKYSLTYYNETSTYSLKVKDLQESDTGFYQCQILITLGKKITADVELQIRRPPTITNTTTNGVVTEGEEIELHCSADGYPVPRISWRREYDTLLSIGGSVFHGPVLKIPKAYRDDRGIYICTAENGVGKEARANVSVVIEFSPVVTAVRPRVGQAQTYDANLECSIEAHPAPVITWLRNGKEVRKDDSRKKPDDFVDYLTVYSVGPSDYGEYVCKAQNKLGEDETMVELFETQIPNECASSCG